MPATSFAKNCYAGIFQDCPSLRIEGVAPGESPTKQGATLVTTLPTSYNASEYGDLFLRCNEESFNISTSPGYSYYWFPAQTL